MRIIELICLISVIVLFSGCGKKVSQKGWYDYGNGLVNLSNVSHIQSEMSFSLKLQEKDKYGDNKTVNLVNGPITKANVAKMRENLKKYSGKWDAVSYAASIRFDGFTLKLQDFDSAGLECTDEGAIKLVELWLSEYQKLLNYLDPYRG